VVASSVLDASAVVAVLRDEPGSSQIAGRCSDGLLSAVNLQEVIKVMFLRGFTASGVKYMVDALQLEIIPHTEDHAYQAAALVPVTAKFGSGLGDRTCMAVAIARGLPAITTDRAWANLSIPGLTVVVAR
jgi:ribonuclease VapC